MAADSEFICEVVLITQLLPHPAADNLLLAKIRTKHGPSGYQIIVRKGDFKEGNLAAYIGTDCVVPLNPPPPGLEFLVEKTSRASHRVRACKLRGLFSEGILVPAPSGAALGHELDSDWGITKYDPFVRSTGTPAGTQNGPLPSRNGHWLGWPSYSVTSLKKVPKLFDGVVVEYQEKIHGSNVRCGWHNGQFIVGSHHTIKTPVSDRKPSWLTSLRRWIGKLFKKQSGYYPTDIWSKAVAPYAEKLRAYDGLVFYGEVYGPGIQPMDYSLKEPGVVFFDVWSRITGQWLSGAAVSNLLYALQLPTPPVIALGDYSPEKAAWHAEGKSLIDGKTQREGVVVSSPFSSMRGKYVSQGYLLLKEGTNR